MPWRQIDLANGSFGQGVAVTPIQLATAYSAMINGGRLVQPHVVSAIGDEELAPSERADALVSPKLSSDLAGLMRHVVTEVDFYRDRTLVPGYDVGGKTGTAQIRDAKAYGGRGAWKTDLFNYSFVGYMGREKAVPDLSSRSRSRRPADGRQGGRIEMPVMSFELFRRVATDAITPLDLLSERAAAGTPAATPTPTAAR